MEYIQILRKDYEELVKKAEKYDNLVIGGKKSSENMTPEERQARARKAQQASVQARKRNAELKKQQELAKIAQDAQSIY